MESIFDNKRREQILNSFFRVKNVEKAYTEGIYADTPQNRKLGRVGMSYTEYTNKIKGGEGKEKTTKQSKNLSITNVKLSTDWLYEICYGGVTVEAKINDHIVKFPFSPAYGGSPFYMGIDCNEVVIDGERINEITKEGTGGHKSYELKIDSDILKSQPKVNQQDFSFTGRYYSTKPIISAFKEKMQKMMNENKFLKNF